jgi:hypothetical protein
MRYWTPYGSSTASNIDSLQYQVHLHSPKPPGAMFSTHADHVAVGPIHWDYTWQRLSESGTTTRMMAVEGSELWYVGTLGKPTHHSCEGGQIILVNPGVKPGTFVVSIPRTSTTPAEPHRRRHTLRQELDTPEDSSDGGVEDEVE